MVVMRVVVPRLTRGMSPARRIARRQSLMEIFAGIVASADGGGSSAPLRRRVQHLLGAYLDDLAGSNVTTAAGCLAMTRRSSREYRPWLGTPNEGALLQLQPVS